MKQHSSDVDSILPWRDWPEGGGVGRGPRRRAGARRARSRRVPRRARRSTLSAIEEDCKTERRARPPFWLRPALVAALLTVSVATVMGYETGWFAPLRERLRFRSIPPAAPEPVEHEKRRATQAETSPANDPAPAPPDIPAADVTADDAAPQVSAPIAAHAPAAKSASAPSRRSRRY